MRERSTHADDRAAYFEADVEFHSLLMSAGGNPVFRSLTPAVIEALRGRSGLGVDAEPVRPAEVDLHLALADAIVAKDPDAAEAAGHRLLEGIEKRLHRT